MAIIKLSATERRRVSVFITCLVLAVFAWFITVLSNPYGYNVKEVLTFKNAPQKRAFNSLQPDTVNVTVNGSGWDMLFSKMSIENKLITVDLRSLEYKNYIVLSSQLDKINSSKEISQQIIAFNPDTLYFDFSNRKEKRVPIHLISRIKYQRQYFQSGNVSLRPKYVLVNGPENMINKISEWETDTLKLDSVSETVMTTVGLQPVSENNITIHPKNVEVTIPVEEFTEKILTVPVKLINNDYGEVKIFPQKVKITFTVALTKYAQIDEDFFEATANMDLWRYHGYKSLPVVVSKVPSFCKIVNIEPANIDFIIKK
jgi:YbbR domain-containing protein